MLLIYLIGVIVCFCLGLYNNQWWSHLVQGKITAAMVGWVLLLISIMWPFVLVILFLTICLTPLTLQFKGK